MFYILVVSFMAAGALAFLFFLRQPANARPSGKGTMLVANDVGQPPRKAAFSGLQLDPGCDACEASRVLSKLTFSARDRLDLPLPTCDRQTCGCKKKPVVERRKACRRQIRDRREKARFDTQDGDRRHLQGRRAGERVWYGGYV